jgi:hypothetical protein
MNKATNIKQNFHLPLSPKLYAELKEQAQERGQPATELARDALESYLRQLRIEKIEAELEAFVETAAGTELDYDSEWAQLGHDVICAAPSGFEEATPKILNVGNQKKTKSTAKKPIQDKSSTRGTHATR